MAKLRSTLQVNKRLHSGAQAPRQYLAGSDIFSGHIGIPVVLVYRKGFDIEAAERALLETLKHYPIVCGRFRKDADGHAYVDCNDAGIDYRVHRCEGALPAYGIDRPLSNSEIKQYFRPFYPWQLFGKDMPLLQVDIHRYEDGGIVLCCYGPHSLFDGSAYWQFMSDWSKACKGLEIKAPSFDHQTVIDAGLTGAQPDGSEPVYDPSWGERLSVFAKLGWRALTDLRKDVIRIPAPLVQKWKDEARAELPAGSAGASTVELATAYVMKTLSPILPAGVDRSVGIVLDLRHKRRIKIPRDYFGNALCYGEARYSPQALANESLAVLAEKCRPLPDQVSTEALFRLMALFEQYRQKKAIWKLFWRPAGETLKGGLILNNCVNFPMYDIDLGNGAPDWYDICAVAFRMLMVVHTPQKDGGLDLHFTARPAELDRLKQALQRDGH